MNSSEILAEFDEGGLGDERLDSRMLRVVGRLSRQPDAPFPQLFPNDAELEGFYRFLRNPRVSWQSVLEPHVQATVDRAAQLPVVLAIHDTSEFAFKGQQREGLGILNRAGRGFLGHFSLLASPEREPLGVAAVRAWARSKNTPTARRNRGEISYAEARALQTEQTRWFEQAEETQRRVAGATELVHLMDSEADDFALMAALHQRGHRFVIRLCYDRLLDEAASRSTPHRKLKDFVGSAETVCTRTVKLSRRNRQPGGGRRGRGKQRDERTATLAVSAKTAVFRRPRSASASLPETLSLNVVHVREIDPPAGVEPVEWLLGTTEPIAGEADIVRVVDYYRARWLVEEYFKALKSGCAYERRQLESLQTLLVALALLIPIAWTLLHLRSVARAAPTSRASTVLTPTQMKVLRLQLGLPESQELSARDVLLAVAKLGGHLKGNGEPGWQVLTRGYQELLHLTAGFVLARSMM